MGDEGGRTLVRGRNAKRRGAILRAGFDRSMRATLLAMHGQQDEGGGKQFAVATTLVAGPPGSGKTTYVRDRAEYGDVIIDVDALYVALSGQPRYKKPTALLPFVLEARDAVEERLLARSDARQAWIIKGAPKREQRDHYANRGATVVVLAVPAEECLRRIADDPEREESEESWSPLVHQWWDDYEPDESEDKQ